jgi:hypothetical protein
VARSTIGRLSASRTRGTQTWRSSSPSAVRPWCPARSRRQIGGHPERVPGVFRRRPGRHRSSDPVKATATLRLKSVPRGQIRSHARSPRCRRTGPRAGCGGAAATTALAARDLAQTMGMCRRSRRFAHVNFVICASIPEIVAGSAQEVSDTLISAAIYFTAMSVRWPCSCTSGEHHGCSAQFQTISACSPVALDGVYS